MTPQTPYNSATHGRPRSRVPRSYGEAAGVVPVHETGAESVCCVFSRAKHIRTEGTELQSQGKLQGRVTLRRGGPEGNR